MADLPTDGPRPAWALRIDGARTARGLTYAALAAMAGVSKSTAWRLCRGAGSSPSLATLHAVESALELSLTAEEQVVDGPFGTASPALDADELAGRLNGLAEDLDRIAAGRSDQPLPRHAVRGVAREVNDIADELTTAAQAVRMLSQDVQATD